MAQLGIKLADGTFYPVMEDAVPRRVRVLLSPAQADQTGAQIDILRRDGDVEQYAGCLVLEKLALPGAGDLELLMSLDAEGTLSARVGDGSGDNFQSLSVSLDHLDEPEHYALPEEGAQLPLGVGEPGEPEDLDLSGLDDSSLDDVSLDDSSLDGSSLDDSGLEIDVAMPDLDDVDLGDVDLGDPDLERESFDDSRNDYFDDSDDDEFADEYDDVPPRQFNPVMLMAIILITLSILALGAYAILRLLGAEMLPELRAAFLVPLFPAPVWRRNG